MTLEGSFSAALYGFLMEFLGDYILLSTVYPPGNTIADRSRMISDASLGKAANQPSSLSYMLLLLGSNNSDIAPTFVLEERTVEDGGRRIESRFPAFYAHQGIRF